MIIIPFVCFHDNFQVFRAKRDSHKNTNLTLAAANHDKVLSAAVA